MNKESSQGLTETPRIWIVTSVCLSIFLMAMDQYIIPISLPQIAQYFNIAIKEISKVVLYYFLTLTGLLIFFGRLGDLLGLKKVFIWGHIFFLSGSLVSSISNSLQILLIGRILQGVGAAALYAMINPVISNYLSSDRHGRTFGFISIVSAIGIAVGAPLGGLITTYLSWRLIFVINFPISIFAIFFAGRYFPENRVRNHGKDKIYFDVLGLVLSVSSLVALMYALNKGGENGWFSMEVISFFCFSLFFVSVFLLWQKRCSSPLLDLKLLKIRGFLSSNLASVLSFLLMAGSGFLLPFYLIQYKGMTADKAGLTILIYSFVYMITSPISGRFSDKIRSNVLCSVGMFMATLASLFFALSLEKEPYWPVFLYLVLSALAYGIFIPPSNRLIMDLVPAEKKGIASGIFKMMSFLGIMLGISFFETIFSYFAHNQIQHLVLGFKNAYFAGALFCFIASILFIYDSLKKRVR